MDLLSLIGPALVGFALGAILVYSIQVVPLVNQLVRMRKEGYLYTYDAEPDRPELSPWDDYIEE
jgi:hypothetical protein